MILTDQNKNWLKNEYPGLTPHNDSVSGVIEFVAVYEETINKFFIIRPGEDSSNGLKLSVKFKIRIEERKNKSISKLPALFVEDLEATQNRHFGQSDFSACLCSPLEEKNYLIPEFDFPQYLERLVVPFLYGQAYYTKYEKWPWKEYTHGHLGLLESYYDTTDAMTKSSILDFLAVLKLDPQWTYYEKLLVATRPSKQNCPCGSGYKFRDCHPKALQGFIKLKKYLNE